MKNFLSLLLVFFVIGSIVYLVWVKVSNNKDEYDRLYEKYLNDSNFECKIFKCTSNSNIEINGITFSLTRDLDVNDRAYYFKLKGNDVSFSGAYNLIEEEFEGMKLPVEIIFTLNISDISYSGVYYVFNQNLALTPSVMNNNYDHSNYMSHKEIANEICKYIVNSVKNDLAS